jgi:hypothetical protein
MMDCESWIVENIPKENSNCKKEGGGTFSSTTVDPAAAGELWSEISKKEKEFCICGMP